MFDSGAGGLTVMRQVMNLMPSEEIIYFGDTARFPYGDKAAKVIQNYAEENAAFLMDLGIKVLVMACNTASAFAFDHLRKTLPIPVVDVITPGAKRAATATQSGHIAVLGTTGTISSGAYQRAIALCSAELRVTAIPCPLFAPLVEERFTEHPATPLIVEEYLGSLRSSDVDTILLGCTHYPMLHTAIHRVVGQDVALIDSAEACAEELLRILQLHGLQSTGILGGCSHRYFVSDNPEKFRLHAAAFISKPPNIVSLR